MAVAVGRGVQPGIGARHRLLEGRFILPVEDGPFVPGACRPEAGQRCQHKRGGNLRRNLERLHEAVADGLPLVSIRVHPDAIDEVARSRCPLKVFRKAREQVFSFR